MATDELAVEIRTLPARIRSATDSRNRLYGHLRELWSDAYLNDHRFITASNLAEAAGMEVVALNRRLNQATRMYKERTSGQLI